MNSLISLDTTNSNSITSIELLNEINIFRGDIEGKNELKHKTLLEVIRDEFEEEITGQEILPSEYKDKSGKSNPMYILTIPQAKQVLVRESKLVRKAVIKRLELLESEFNRPKSIEEMQRDLLIAYERRDLEKHRSINHGYKSVIGRKDSVINGVKQLTGASLQREVVGSVESIVRELDDIKSNWLIPRDLGIKIGLTSRNMNTELKNAMLQYKPGKHWVLTERGEKYGRIEISQNIEKGYKSTQIYWDPKVLELLGFE